MGNGKNAYLQRQEAKRQAFMGAAEGTTRQFDVDTLQIAINKTEGWGYDRIMRLTLAWEQARAEYGAALSPTKNAEADVAQEHMDQALMRIIGKRQELIPFEERYPDLKKVRYK